MAPAQASAKKRTLPREFVAPDPGPMAVLSVPRSDWDRHPLENMPPDSVTEPETRKAEAATVPDKAQQFPSILKTENRPANPKSDTENGREAKPHKHALISTSKIGAMGPHRAPLAPLTGQRSLQQAPADSSEKSASKVCTTASASLSSRVPFKPSSALNGKTQSRPPASSDTRSLLAALHALKRPA